MIGREEVNLRVSAQETMGMLRSIELVSSCDETARGRAGATGEHADVDDGVDVTGRPARCPTDLALEEHHHLGADQHPGNVGEQFGHLEGGRPDAGLRIVWWA